MTRARRRCDLRVGGHATHLSMEIAELLRRSGKDLGLPKRSMSAAVVLCWLRGSWPHAGKLERKSLDLVQILG